MDDFSNNATHPMDIIPWPRLCNNSLPPLDAELLDNHSMSGGNRYVYIVHEPP